MESNHKASILYKKIINTDYPIKYFDAYSLTLRKDSCGVCMVLFSTIFNRNEINFGILVALGPDLETHFYIKRCLEIIRNNKLSEDISECYPNWGLNHGLAATLINENIFNRSKYINFKTPYVFKTPKLNSFEVGYDNILKDYPEGSINLAGYPDVEGIPSSLLFIDKNIIAYHDSKPIGINDTYGLSEFVQKNEEELINWGKKLAFEHGITEPLLIDFVWCGNNIKPYGSVSDIDRFCIVYFIGSYNKKLNRAIWKEPVFSITDKALRIFDVRAIKQYRFILPANRENNNNITLFKSFNRGVECNCPIASYFGKEGRCGAGIIWHVEFSDKLKHFFLLKTNANVAVNKLSNNKLDNFIDNILTHGRLNEIAMKVGDINPKNLTTFIAELYSSILISESKYIKNNYLNLEDLEQEVWYKGAKWYRAQYFQNK